MGCDGGASGLQARGDWAKQRLSGQGGWPGRCGLVRRRGWLCGQVWCDVAGVARLGGAAGLGCLARFRRERERERERENAAMRGKLGVFLIFLLFLIFK